MRYLQYWLEVSAIRQCRLHTAQMIVTHFYFYKGVMRRVLKASQVIIWVVNIITLIVIGQMFQSI